MNRWRARCGSVTQTLNGMWRGGLLRSAPLTYVLQIHTKEKKQKTCTKKEVHPGDGKCIRMETAIAALLALALRFWLSLGAEPGRLPIGSCLGNPLKPFERYIYYVSAQCFFFHFSTLIVSYTCVPSCVQKVLDKHGNLWLKLGSTSLPPAIESSESNSSYGANRDLPLQGWLLVRPGGPGAPPVCRPLSGPGSSVPLCTACCEPLILQDHSANTSNNNLGSTNGSISCTGRFSRVTATGVRAGDQLFLFSSLEPVTVLRTTREGWIACKFGPHNQEDRGDGDDAAIDAGNDDGDDEDGGSVLYHCDALFKLATAPSSSLLGAPPRGSELVFKEDDTRWVLDAWHTRRELWLRCSRDTKRARNAWAAAAAAPQPSSSSSAPLTSSRSSNESNGEASTIGHHFASCLSGHLLHSRCFQVIIRL